MSQQGLPSAPRPRSPRPPRPTQLLLLLAATCCRGKLLDLDSESIWQVLGGPADALVMFGARDCFACENLKPHLEQLQSRLNMEGFAIIMVSIDAEKQAGFAGAHNVTGYPSFVLFPKKEHPERQGKPSFGGTYLPDLAKWLMHEQVKAAGESGPAGRFDRAEGMMHPAARMPAESAGGKDGISEGVPKRRLPRPRPRAPPPEPLPSTPRGVDCGRAAEPGALDLVLAGELIEVTDHGGGTVAVAAWSPPPPPPPPPLPSNAPPAPASRAPAAGAAGAAGGSWSALGGQRGLAGVAGHLLRNGTCIYATGVLRPRPTEPTGYDGPEEAVALWAPGAGWRALRGVVRGGVRPRPPPPEYMYGRPLAERGRPQSAATPPPPPTRHHYSVGRGPVSAIERNGSLLFLGGGFDLVVDPNSAPGQAELAPDLAPRYLVAWDVERAEWLPLGDGLDSAVHAMAFDGSRGLLYVAGAFRRAGEIPAEAGLAAWDGDKWWVPPLAASAPADGMRLLQLMLGNGRLYARAEDGSVHACDGGGCDGWLPMPSLPVPLRAASALAWVPRKLRALRRPPSPPPLDTDDDGGVDGGGVVVGADFVVYDDGGIGCVAEWDETSPVAANGAWHAADGRAADGHRQSGSGSAGETLLAAAKLGDGHGLAWWIGGDRWQKVSLSGNVRHPTTSSTPSHAQPNPLAIRWLSPPPHPPPQIRAISLPTETERASYLPPPRRTGPKPILWVGDFDPSAAREGSKAEPPPAAASSSGAGPTRLAAPMDEWPPGWPQAKKRDPVDQLSLLGALIIVPLLYLGFHALQETRPERLVRGSKARSVGWKAVAVGGGRTRWLRRMLARVWWA